MKNRMKEVAEMLGVELDEEFDVINQDGELIYGCPYKITNEGFKLSTGQISLEIAHHLLTGGCSIIKKPWKPKNGEYFYIVLKTGEACSGVYRESTSDVLCIAFGNCFKTREEAESHADEMVEKMKKALE